MDLVVEDAIVVEIKSIEELLPIHDAQLLTYLRASEKRVGLLLNFNVVLLKNGLRRKVNHFTGSFPSSLSSPSSLSPPRLYPLLCDSAVNSGPLVKEPL
jgi:hypothetical protein